MENVLVTGFCGGYLCPMNINELKPDGRNYNKGTDKGRKLVKRSLKELGAGRSVLVDKDGNIIAGNKTVEAAKALGYDNILIVPTDGKTLVAVQRTDVALDSEQGRALALADNAAADLAWDYETLAHDWGNDMLEGWGIDMQQVQPKAVEDDFSPPKIEGIKTDIQRGDIIEIGPHRLMCGDSTVEADVDRLIGGERADICVTDPPYGVKMDKGFEGFGGFGKPIKRRQYNDNWDGEIPDKKAFEMIIKCAKTIIIFGGNFFAHILPQSKHWIFWDKKQTMPTFGDGELCWTNIDRKSVVKIEVTYNGLIGKEDTRFHPTQKPVKIIYEILQRYSGQNTTCVDFFLGSGTTMVASHQLNRRCYAMEIDPKYCQVTVDRMRKLDPSIEIKKNGQPYPVNTV